MQQDNQDIDTDTVKTQNIPSPQGSYLKIKSLIYKNREKL